jgi:ATP-dependent Lhr-like helicase
MAKNEPNVDAFSLLAKPIRNSLNELGFTVPTLAQKMAIPRIIAGENILLIAPTGTGKTEAVLLPIFSKLIQQKARKSIAVIYITPLRALNRDLLKRLSFWSSRLDISIEVRHGDTERKLRRKQAIFPPEILVTTPETLQAILPGTRMRQHLTNVRYVIIDEVHELASSKRGAQLSVALERLQEFAQNNFQRIGLSATVGNPDVVAHLIAGVGRKIKVIEASSFKSYKYRVENPDPIESDYDLAAKLDTAPEAAARIRRIAELVDDHKATLIFVNARTIAEMIGYRFHQLGRNDIAVHHGSLSKEERAQIEDEFKAGTLKAIICTSTLELGIDIGTVDMVIQYLSPRQVNSLIQRVGRSGHRLDLMSDGVIMTAFPDDTLESMAAVSNAYENKLEPVLVHECALDVLAHQIVGTVMDKGTEDSEDVLSMLKRSYPYRKLEKDEFLDMIHFLQRLGNIEVWEEGKVLGKSRKTRTYYYENLSMIADEKRYPVINVISDRKIGTLGDEFMALKARVGLNIIVRGRVWRIVQIEEETGSVYVVPSEDPLAAIPGWDGEMIPVPFDLAQETGKLRDEITEKLKTAKNAEATADSLAVKLSTDGKTLLDTVKEIEEQLRLGAAIPTHNQIAVESFDKYLIINACFGELVNRTLGGVFDAILSEREVIVGWWNDGYRILIETPRKMTLVEIQNISAKLFGLTSEEVDNAFKDYLDAKFPFSYKMKFVAERFGALTRGKTMSYERLSQLPSRFAGTPIQDETIREAMIEKVDLEKTKEIMSCVKNGQIRVRTMWSKEKPTPISYHILARYSDMAELMAPEHVLLSNIDRMKMAIEARTARMLCMSCGEWFREEKIKNLTEQTVCGRCGSKLLAPLYRSQDVDHLRETLKKRRDGKDLTDEELKELTRARREADLVLSYGTKAITALEVKGVGPETASRILGKMHPKDEEFYMDLLKAKIQYLRTRAFWDEKENHKRSNS